jgi:hypothetical protein
VVVSWWEGELDRKKLNEVLGGKVESVDGTPSEA